MSKVRDLDEYAVDEQLLASESLDGESGDDHHRDTQSVNADSEQSISTDRQSAAVTDDLLEGGVDGSLSTDFLQCHDGRHHRQPPAHFAQHRQLLVQRQVLQRRPTSR